MARIPLIESKDQLSEADQAIYGETLRKLPRGIAQTASKVSHVRMVTIQVP
jgi:hypothetical protein